MQEEEKPLPDFSLMIAVVDKWGWKIHKEVTPVGAPARWTVRERDEVYAESHTMRRAVANAMERKEKETQ